MIAQDQLKRALLDEHETPQSLTPDLINTLLVWAINQHLQFIIIEGILPRQHYQACYHTLATINCPIRFYYLNATFAQAWQRNLLKPTPFSKATMQNWWLSNGDPIAFTETILPNTMSLPEQVSWICSQLNVPTT